MLKLSAKWADKRHLGDNISHDQANYSATGGKDNWDCRTATIKQFDSDGYGLYYMMGQAMFISGVWIVMIPLLTIVADE